MLDLMMTLVVPLTLGLAAVFDWFLKKFDRSVLKIGKS